MPTREPSIIIPPARSPSDAPNPFRAEPGGTPAPAPAPLASSSSSSSPAPATFASHPLLQPSGLGPDALPPMPPFPTVAIGGGLSCAVLCVASVWHAESRGSSQMFWLVGVGMALAGVIFAAMAKEPWGAWSSAASDRLAQRASVRALVKPLALLSAVAVTAVSLVLTVTSFASIKSATEHGGSWFLFIGWGAVAGVWGWYFRFVRHYGDER